MHKIIKFRSMKTAVYMVFFATVTGCALNQSRSLADQVNEQRIATNLVSTLIQIPDYQPFNTTIRMSSKRRPFGDSIYEAVTSSGYGVQLVDSEQDKNHVDYKTKTTSRNGENISRYEISINDVVIAREFTREGHYLFPASETIIKGIEPVAISAQDDLYRQHGGNTVFTGGVRFIDADDKTVHVETSQINLTEAQRPAIGDVITSQQFLTLAKSRIFTHDRISTDWGSPENQFTPVRDTTIIFGNDMLRIGAENKNTLSELTNDYVENQSVFELFACNHGKTLSFDGTESVALERSLRTKEELLTLGVKLSDIKENGCFISELEMSIPENGVIVTLNNRIK